MQFHKISNAPHVPLQSLTLLQQLLSSRTVINCGNVFSRPLKAAWKHVSREQLIPNGCDGDGNKNRKKAKTWIVKKTTLHVQHTFFVHFSAATAQLQRENVQFHVLWRT